MNYCREVSFKMNVLLYASGLVLCANKPLLSEITEPCVTFFKSIFGANILLPTSQTFVVLGECLPVKSSKEIMSAGFDKLNTRVPEYPHTVIRILKNDNLMRLMSLDIMCNR